MECELITIEVTPPRVFPYVYTGKPCPIKFFMGKQYSLLVKELDSGAKDPSLSPMGTRTPLTDTLALINGN